MLKSAVLGAALLAVAACSGPSTQQQSSSSSVASRLNLPGTQTTDTSQSTAVAASPVRQRECPGAELRDGTQTERVYEPGREGDPQGVLYQAAINRVARDCIYGSDGSVSVRFGVAGRVIMGPLGVPGQRTVAIRAVLFTAETGPVWIELFTVTVDLATGRASQPFSLVQQTPATLIPAGDNRPYRVIVGFDTPQ